MRTPRLRKRRQVTAPATVIYTSVDSVPSIFVECSRSGIRVGPVKSQTDVAVKKLVTQLTHKCDCGCRAHGARYAEGQVPAQSLLGL